MEQEKLIALVKKARSGDSSAMEQLLTIAHTTVSYQCRKFMNSPEDAEDMTQEVLMVIYQKLDTLTDPAAFNGWVKRIAATRCMNAVSRTHVDLQFAEDEEGNSILDTIEELDSQKVPEAALDNAETARMVVELIDALPEAQRICTYLYYYDELSIKEIAELTTATENTVKSRLNYARKAIKEGVLDHEKKGVKLYGLSPLPFLVYFLRMAAQAEANSAAAASCVTSVMAVNAATAASAAAAAATNAAAAGTTATATTATTATAVSGKVAGGVARFLSKKLIAGIVAGAVALGGGAVATVQLVNSHAETVPAIICHHEWEEANCMTPKTCNKCNSTEGKALAHTWLDADCEHAKTCEACNTTEGEAFGHTWIDATCETAKTCEVCNTVEGEPLGHNMTEANYQQPATCKNCEYTEGEALTAGFLGHGLTVINAELGVEYDYITTCYKNKDYKTTGKLTLSDYQTFASDEAHEAVDGYEWHSVHVSIVFNDDNAWNYGMSIRNFSENYYQPTPWSVVNTVNFNGIDYGQYEEIWSDWETDGWDKENKTITYTVNIAWSMPVGYDGYMFGFYDAGIETVDGQYIWEFMPAETLIFRFSEQTEVGKTALTEEEPAAPESAQTVTEQGTPEANQWESEADVQNTATVPSSDNNSVAEEDHTGMFYSKIAGWVKHECGTDNHIYNDDDCVILQEMTCTQPKIYQYTCRVVGCGHVEIMEKKSDIPHYRSTEDATAYVTSWKVSLFDYNTRMSKEFTDEEAMRDYVRQSVAAYQNGTSVMWVEQIIQWQKYQGPDEYVCQTCGLTYRRSEGALFLWNGDEDLTEGITWKNTYTPENQPTY